MGQPGSRTARGPHRGGCSSCPAGRRPPPGPGRRCLNRYNQQPPVRVFRVARQMPVSQRVTVDGDLVRRVTMALIPIRRIAVACALVAAVGLLTMVAAASATGASQPQRRQLAVTALSDFRAVLTATREPGHPLLATVTAAGYRRSGGRWTLIATKRIGT